MPRRIALAAATGLGGALILGAVLPRWDAPLTAHLTWMALALMAFAVELAVVRLDGYRTDRTVPTHVVPITAGLVLAAPVELVVGAVLGALLARLVARQGSLPRWGMDGAHLLFTTAAVAAAVHLTLPLGPFAGSAWWRWLVVTVAVLVGDLVTLSLDGAGRNGWQRPPWPVRIRPRLARVRPWRGLVALSLVSFTLAATEVAHRFPEGLVLLVAPTAAAFIGFRAHRLGVRRGERTELMYRSMRRVQAAADIRGAVVELLDEARWLFRADAARIMLMPLGRGEAALHSSLGPGDAMELMVPTEPDAVTDPDSPAEHVLTTALVVGGVSVGWVRVARTAQTGEPFDAGDRSLLDTYAGHVAQALENSRLQQSLDAMASGQALADLARTDALTGLADRALLSERLVTAVRRGRGLVGVIRLEVENLDDIVDQHGHRAGERMLVAVSGRLRACLRAEDTAARLDAGQFALVLDGITDRAEAVGVCDRVGRLLGEPVDIGARRVRVSAAVGLAVGSPGQTSSPLLMDGAAADMLAHRRRTGADGEPPAQDDG